MHCLIVPPFDMPLTVSAALCRTATPDATPWFTRYREEYIETLRFSPYEFLDHPIASKCMMWRLVS